MSWKNHWPHVSQLYAHRGDPPDAIEGANDCFEACVARYLRETGFDFMSRDDAALIDFVRVKTTGQPDQALQGPTTLAQAKAGLSALCITFRWTNSLQLARASEWAIWWVDARSLYRETPNVVGGQRLFTDYPRGWLAGTDQFDHFILRLPNGVFNDPLSYWNGRVDSKYTVTSEAMAFGGAFILDAPVPKAPSGPSAKKQALYSLATKENVPVRMTPTSSASTVSTVQPGDIFRDAYESCPWVFITVRGTYGWVRRELVKTQSE